LGRTTKEEQMTEQQVDRPERRDKGMVHISPVTPTKHATLMPVVFHDLPEAACATMGYEAAPLPKLSPVVRRGEGRYTRDDYNYDADKKWLRGKR
jgi:hypothetical protein